MHTDVIVAVPAWVLLAYLISGVCFILALRGLSSPESSRRGNLTGMAGMTIAVVTTLATHEIASLPEIIGATPVREITQPVWWQKFCALSRNAVKFVKMLKC